MKKLNVLVDYHHAGLLNSLILLFEGRLGGSVFRPIGVEWYDEGFWDVYPHPATVQQYLTLAQGYKPEDGSKPLNNIEKVEDDIYYCQDIDSGYYNKAITLDTFKNTKFDIIIASLPQHIEPYKKLIELYQPGAKLIFQVGNQWDGIYAPNIMASAKLHNMPPDINWIEYHQEFDLSLFKPSTYYDYASIRSYMNIPDAFPDYQLLLNLEQALGWDVKIHGGMGRDGPLHGAKQVAHSMNTAQFVWHVKSGGDGYGHILFNSAACGVPLIVKKSYYQGKLGEKLLIDGQTCIDIDGLDIGQIIDRLTFYSQPDNYRVMRARVYENFVRQVDFDEDEKNIRAFLDRLQ